MTTNDFLLILFFVLLPTLLPSYLLQRNRQRRQAIPWVHRSVGTLTRLELEALMRRVMSEELVRHDLSSSAPLSHHATAKAPTLPASSAGHA